MTAIHYWISILAFDLLNKTIPVERNLTRESPLDLFYLMTNGAVRHERTNGTFNYVDRRKII